MNWLPFAILLLLSHSTYILYRRFILRASPRLHTITAALMYSVFWICSLAYAFVSGKVDLASIQQTDVAIYLFGGGFAYAVVLALENYIISRVDAAQFTIIAKAGIIFVLLAGWILLGETLTFQQLTGGVVILIAALLVMPKITQRTITFNSVTIVCIVFALLGALLTTNEKYVLGKITMQTYMVFGWGMQTLGLWCLSAISYRRWRNSLTISHVKKSLLGGFLTLGLGVGYTLTLVTSDSLPLTHLVDSFSAVLVVLGSILLLKEKEDIPKKLVATALGFGGLLLLIF